MSNSYSPLATGAGDCACGGSCSGDSCVVCASASVANVGAAVSMRASARFLAGFLVTLVLVDALADLVASLLPGCGSSGAGAAGKRIFSRLCQMNISYLLLLSMRREERRMLQRDGSVLGGFLGRPRRWPVLVEGAGLAAI